MNERWYERWGGRKFLMCSGFGVAFCLMFQFGKLSEAGFQFLMGGTVLVYVAGNVGQKAIAKKSTPDAIAPSAPSGTTGQ